MQACRELAANGEARTVAGTARTAAAEAAAAAAEDAAEALEAKAALSDAVGGDARDGGRPGERLRRPR